MATLSEHIGQLKGFSLRACTFLCWTDKELGPLDEDGPADDDDEAVPDVKTTGCRLWQMNQACSLSRVLFSVGLQREIKLKAK